MKIVIIKNKANLAHDVDLEKVLTHIGCIMDRFDKNKWHTCKGSISIIGQKLLNWTKGIGGGGAIDLDIHLNDCNFKTVVSWLLNNFSSSSSDCKGKKTLSIGSFHSFRISPVKIGNMATIMPVGFR